MSVLKSGSAVPNDCALLNCNQESHCVAAGSPTMSPRTRPAMARRSHCCLSPSWLYRSNARCSGEMATVAGRRRSASHMLAISNAAQRMEKDAPSAIFVRRIFQYTADCPTESNHRRSTYHEASDRPDTNRSTTKPTIAVTKIRPRLGLANLKFVMGRCRRGGRSEGLRTRSRLVPRWRDEASAPSVARRVQVPRGELISTWTLPR